MSLLGIDLGTGSVKVVLTDAAGEVLATAEAGYPVERPETGWAQTDPEAWWQGITGAVARVLAARPGDPPVAIGLSGQMHGVVLCAADGTPTRPAVLWADARAEAELGVYRSLPPAVQTRLANPLSPGMAGPELAWLHRHEPEAVGAARFALQPKDWVRARLTGEFGTEPSDASATLLFDVLAQTWDDDVVAALGIRREILPDLLPFAGAEAGRLRAPVAADLGLAAGLPVAAGAGDTAAAALGSGLLEVGTTQLTIGTGVQFVTPIVRPDEKTLPPPFPSTHRYRAATRDGWYAMAAGLTGGQTLGWVRRLLGLDWGQLYAAAERGPQPGDPVFLPHLIGERTPYMDTRMRGAWAGLDARHDREALAYAALEGVAFAVADAYDELRAVHPTVRSGEGIRLAGGGTVAAGWQALLAAVLGTTLHAVEIPGASARGAALLAAQVAGLVSEADLAEVARPRIRAGVLPAHDQWVADRRALYHGALQALRPLPFRP
jgi:xylulokinase